MVFALTGEQVGQRRLDAAGRGHGAAAERRRDGHGTEERADDVGHAQRQHLLRSAIRSGFDWVFPTRSSCSDYLRGVGATAGAERHGDGDLFQDADQRHQGQRRAHFRRNGAETHRRRGVLRRIPSINRIIKNSIGKRIIKIVMKWISNGFSLKMLRLFVDTGIELIRKKRKRATTTEPSSLSSVRWTEKGGGCTGGRPGSMSPVNENGCHPPRSSR